MTPVEFAARLNGREYGSEITEAEEAEAKAHGLVVMFGYSDDNVELRGAITDEISAYEGITLRIVGTEILSPFDSLDHDDEQVMEKYFELKSRVFRMVECLWCAEEGVSWTFKTDTPHATFDVKEHDELFCRGIVFHV